MAYKRKKWQVHSIFRYFSRILKSYHYIRGLHLYYSWYYIHSVFYIYKPDKWLVLYSSVKHKNTYMFILGDIQRSSRASNIYIGILRSNTYKYWSSIGTLEVRWRLFPLYLQKAKFGVFWGSSERRSKPSKLVQEIC